MSVVLYYGESGAARRLKRPCSALRARPAGGRTNASTGAGFADIESFSFDVDVPYSHEGWRGRIRASSGVAASLAPEAVERFDAAHRELLARKFPDDPLLVPHRVFAVFGRAPAA